MTILYYISKISKASQRLISVMEAVVTHSETEIFNSVGKLTQRLRNPFGSQGVVILFVRSEKELSELVQIKDLLTDIRVILILPNRMPDTISNACKMYPRFLSYTDSDFKDVAAVLQKMISSFDRNKNISFTNISDVVKNAAVKFDIELEDVLRLEEV